MNTSAQKVQVVITNVSSFFGMSLASSLLSKGYQVFGIGKTHVPEELIENQNFTLLDLNLAQPLPEHLAHFDIIIHLASEFQRNQSLTQHASPITANIIKHARDTGTQVFIVLPVTVGTDELEYTLGSTGLPVKFLLLGDLYGPQMPIDAAKNQNHKNDFTSSNELSSLIIQAATTDKVILEKEGLSLLYPVYITDAISATIKFLQEGSGKNVEYLVSEDAQTSLSVAYKIQNTARIVLEREIGLFFSGPEPIVKPEPEPEIKISGLSFSPKVGLETGLTQVFKYFKENKIVKETPKSTNFQNEQPKIQFPRPQAEITQTKVGEHTPRIKVGLPHFDNRLRKLLVLAAFIIVVFVGKTALDLHLATANLKSIKQRLEAGNFKEAQASAEKSAKSFRSASSEIGFAAYPFSILAPNQIQSLKFALEAGSSTADASVYFVQAAQVMTKNFASITQKAKSDGLDLETPSANLKRAFFEATKAREFASHVQSSLLKSKMEKAKNEIENLAELSSAGFDLSNLTTDLVGSDSKKTYLILLQNNTELRPGGGFIGSYALISFDQGKLNGVKVEDVYTADGQLKEKIEPPKELKEKLGVDNFYLRDSNWSPDFSLNSKIARDFFKKETGQGTDGVISVDLSFIQAVLAKVGPVKLADYNNEEITDKNLFERGEFHSEIGFFPGSTQKRDFFGLLTRTLIAQVLDGLKNPDQTKGNSKAAISIVEAAREALVEKHLMVSFDNANLASYVHTKGWDNPLPPAQFNPQDDAHQIRDFLALAEANLGANKVNRQLDRKIDYEMTVGRDGQLSAKVKITYTNKSQASTWPAGPYVNYLRIYTPGSATLTDYKNGDKTDQKEVQIGSQANVNTFGFFVEVPPKSTKEVSLAYTIPKILSMDKVPIYALYVEKQAGTDQDPLSVTFNLPAYLFVKTINGQDQKDQKQNANIKTDLSQNRQFEFEIAKK